MFVVTIKQGRNVEITTEHKFKDFAMAEARREFVKGLEESGAKGLASDVSVMSLKDFKSYVKKIGLTIQVTEK